MKATLGALTAIILFVSACTNAGQKSGEPAKAPSQKQANLTYTCPMHPEVISDRHGKCPKCKMDLVEKKFGGDSTDAAGHSGH